MRADMTTASILIEDALCKSIQRGPQADADRADVLARTPTRDLPDECQSPNAKSPRDRFGDFYGNWRI